jgi:hypothetical protein
MPFGVTVLEAADWGPVPMALYAATLNVWGTPNNPRTFCDVAAEKRNLGLARIGV